MGNPRLAIARRELGSLRKEKTIVLALAIQLFVAAFSSFLVVGLVSLYDPSAANYQVDVAVTGGEAAVNDLIVAIDGESGLAARPYPSVDTAMTAFEERQVDAVVEASTGPNGRVHLVATAPDSGVETTAVVVRLRDALRALERTERAERSAFLSTDPLPVPPATESSPYFGFTYTVLVPLLLFLPVFIAGSLVVDSLTEEVARGTLELLRVAPVSFSAVVDGKLLAAGGLAPIQAVAWMALLQLNGTGIDNLAWLFGMVTGLTAVVVTLGATVSITAPDRRIAQLLYSLGVLLVFAGTSLLPLSPANSAARLALGTAGLSARLAVVGLVVVGLVSLVGLRVVVGRVDPNELG
ncbi:ABC transporter permease subunit [Haloferax sp. MBLA0076]|uniref:ABC transporter permease subunit n=1 Tax=Haloferax litoreum TaxID=2666140 RepID=A0A6A8GJ55_9EURY|nr:MULTISPECIES: ABC transporter permease [Haloferax]KAB1194337.1 ABC transporter permease [Haloferax sp. CBA1148]MRX22899.1 ABC transporter permease subunit [Haloferax litoreum]